MDKLDPNLKRLAAIAFGEASTENIEDEIAGIAFAVANRARAWGNKTVDELLQADPNYTYAINGKNVRYEMFMRVSSEQDIQRDQGMRLAWEAAKRAWDNEGPDPSNGAYWWDGVDFKKNYRKHPKVRAGFQLADPSHNILQTESEKKVEVTVYWRVVNKETGKEVDSKVRGKYSYMFLSTAAYGKTIFWKYHPEYLSASGGKAYR